METNIKVIWPSEVSNNSNTMEEVIEYQTHKSQYLFKELESRYQQLDQTLREEYPLYKTLKDFELSEDSKAFISCLILEKTQKKDHTNLKIMDFSGLCEIQMLKEEVGQYTYESLIEGLHIGLLLKKQKKKNFEQKRTLKNLLKESIEWKYVLKKVIWPDLPDFKWTPGLHKAVLVSDIHCGSLTFLKENFINLIKKINLDPSIRYLILNGDLVEGCDVYPNQSADLNIKTYLDQYEFLCSILGGLRADIEVLAQPGNHDMVRKIEPQFFPEQVQKIFKKHLKKITFLSNPSYFKLDTVYFYLTHGTSYNGIISAIPWLDSSNCVEASQYLCKIRNVSPLREMVPIAPNKTLYHLIPSKVNVISAGHMHNQGIKLYKGRLLINTGAWQHLTPYMKLLGVTPSLAQAVCVDLADPQNYSILDLRDETTDIHTYNRAALEKET